MLLLDELTTFLDTDDAQTVLEAVKDVISKDSNVAVIWVRPHDRMPSATSTSLREARPLASQRSTRACGSSWLA